MATKPSSRFYRDELQLRRCRRILARFFGRRQQPRAGTQDSAIGPFTVAARALRRGRRGVLRSTSKGASGAFAKKYFPYSRFSVKPSREQAQLILQFTEALLRMG